MAQPKVAIRLGTEGKQDIVRAFKEVGDAGDAAAQRATRAFDRAAADMESAQRRQVAAAQKLAAIMPQTAMQARINMAVGTGSSLDEGSARLSAAAFRELIAEQERYQASAARIRATLDPAWAAQQRFNSEMAEARVLVSAGVLSLDEYCAKLQQEQRLLNETAQAQGRANASSGAMRAGMQQLGFQTQDFIVQVVGGTDATRAFAMQAPQAIGALQMMSNGATESTGRLAAYARILSGPVGIGLGIAIPLVVMLGEQFMGSAKSEDEARKAAEKHKAAIDALNASMRASIQTAEDKARANFILLESERLATAQAERSLQAQLATAKADAEKKRNDVKMTARGDVINPGFVAAAQEVTRIEAELAKSQERLAELTRSSTIAMGQYQRIVIDQMMTPRGQVNRRYEREINAAIGRGDAEAIARLTRERDAELKKIDDSAKALHSANSAREKESATVSQMSKFILTTWGGQVTSTTGGKHVDGSDHYKGRAIDFVPAGGVDSLNKEMIRAAFAELGVSIRRNAKGVEQLFGPGDKGHSDHWHVAWEGGKDAINSSRIMDQALAEQARKDLAMERERNEWLNSQDVGKTARDALEKEGEALAENARIMREQRADLSSGTALLNLEWELRKKNRDEASDTLEIERYRLDIMSRYPQLTADQVAELITAKQNQVEMNRLLEDYSRAWQEFENFGEGIIDTVLDPTAWDDWGDLGKKVLNDLMMEMIKLAAINPLKNMLFGSGLPTLGGVFGSIFGGGGAGAGIGALAPAGTYNSAIGSEYTPAGAMLLGENGPEMAMMPRGAKVLTAGDTRRAMAGMSGNQVITVHVDAKDAVLAETVRGWVSEGVAVAIEQGANRGAALAASEGRYTSYRSLDGM